MKVLVIGGDGYCGWATALHLSNRSYDVGILDRLIRRHWDAKLGVESLTPIAPIQQRLQRWPIVIGKAIALLIGDTHPYEFLQQAMLQFDPDAVVQFGKPGSNSLLDYLASPCEEISASG